MRTVGRPPIAIGITMFMLGIGASSELSLGADIDLIDADARHAIKSALSLSYQKAFWPDPNDVVGDPVPLHTINAGVIEGAVEGIRAILRGELVPADLGARFEALRVNLVPGQARPYVVDTLLARYELGGWNLQLREYHLFLSIVCRPLQPIPEPDPEKYALRVAREVLRMPKADAEAMTVSSVSIGGQATPEVPGDHLRFVLTTQERKVWYGLLRCGAYEAVYHSMRPDRPKDAWLGQIWTMTDGSWVYFGIYETHKPPGRPRPTPRAIPRFPVARRPVSEPTTTRRGVRPPVNLPLEAGLVLPSTAPSE